MEGKEQPEGRRVRKREALQQKVIDIAMQVFAEQGFEQATMEAIAAKADIAKATLYRYFPVKEAILAGYWRYRALEQTELVDKLLARHKTTRKRLEYFLEASLGDALENGNLFAAYLRFRTQHLNEEVLQEQLRSGQSEHIYRILAQGVEAGEIRGDLPLRLMAAQFGMAFILLFFSAHKHPGRFESKKVIAGFVELYLHGAASHDH
jgi:AcrR family transcriptional regulator